ncbi:hypothetical protein BH11MYX2_BH11MYX2_07690 [soil metagenome]
MRFNSLAVAALVALAGCATDAVDDELYEDGPDTDGKADGVTLTPQVAVTSYAATSQQLVTTANVTGLLGGSIAMNTPVVAIRTLSFGGVTARVVVDARSLHVIVASNQALSAASRPATTGELDTTPYLTALHTHDNLAYVGLDAQAFGGDAPDRFVVTVDMCQSSRVWEQGLFETLVALGTTLGEPVPVGIAMTGRWANAHPRELAKLIAWDNTNALRITWIDHSYNHPLNLVDGEYTFMTAPSVDMPSEVLRLEALLLSQRVVPSPFFRFPGLTHNAHRLDQVNGLGLLALDGNAWLAKGEPIRDGRVVLVHGNGNEHVGITKFNDELKTWRPRLLARTAEIVPVSRVVANATP